MGRVPTTARERQLGFGSGYRFSDTVTFDIKTPLGAGRPFYYPNPQILQFTIGHRRKGIWRTEKPCLSKLPVCDCHPCPETRSALALRVSSSVQRKLASHGPRALAMGTRKPGASPQPLALIICSACFREVSVSFAPDSMRATSSVRSSPEI